MSTMLRTLRASTPVESFCDVVRMVGIRLIIVLKSFEVLVADRSLIGGDAHAVIRIFARLHPVDDIAHHQRVRLRRAEDECLLVLVDLVHEELHAILFALGDDDNSIELALDVSLARHDFRFDDRVIRRVRVVINRCGDLPHLERREEAVGNAVL